MDRRVFLTGVGASLVATAAGCLGESSDENGEISEEGGTPVEDCGESIKTGDGDSYYRL